MIRVKGVNDEERYHPTQKPYMLMVSVIRDLLPECKTIFDPFMGSGTTGLASISLGRKFIGCEKDINYINVAEKRIKESLLQPSLFTRTAKENNSQPEQLLF